MKNVFLLILAGVVGGLVTLSADRLLKAGPDPGADPADPAASLRYQSVRYAGASTDSLNGVFREDFRQAAQRSLREVVHIRATVAAGGGGNPGSLPDFFGGQGNPFGEDLRRRGFGQASGSGVIIRPDGHIVTNNHVVAGATHLEVSLYNNRTYRATVIGTDPSTDLALIKIDARNLPATTFANSDRVQVGDWVLAVGNPFDLASTVTAGIVSAKARNIHILEDNSAIESFIQTDAAVNPGNSGGALVNLRGELVGVNTAIATPTGTYAGYAFAVPSNLVAKITEDLLRHGTVQRAYLGLTIQDLDANRNADQSVSEGVLVEGVVNGGAAAGAGVQPGDVIVAANGQAVRSSAELLETVARHRPGDEFTLQINQRGKEKQVRVRLKGQTSQP